jgi:hypothetical protein
VRQICFKVPLQLSIFGASAVGAARKNTIKKALNGHKVAQSTKKPDKLAVAGLI